MANTRVTHVSLLVDRVVSRNARVTADFLLIDETKSRDDRITSFGLIVDHSMPCDIRVSNLAIVVDYLTTHYTGDLWSQTSEFTYEVTVPYIEKAYTDEWEESDEFTEIVIREYNEEFEDEHTQNDLFDQFKLHRADVFQYYLDIVDYINTFGAGAVSPGYEYLDMTDDGWINSEDPLSVLTWYNFGLIYKNVPTQTWAMTQTWYLWPSISVSTSTSWTQTNTFTSDLQRLGYTDTWNQTEVWNNPGNINIKLVSTWNQTGIFTVEPLDQKFNDVWQPVESWDAGAKVRLWTDAWVSTDSFNINHITDIWAQTSIFTLEAHVSNITVNWTQTDSFKIPYTQVINETWTQTSIFSDAAAHSDILDNWAQTDIWVAGAISVNWSDNAQVAALFASDTLLGGMVSWLAYTLERVRSFQNTINWFEQWCIELEPVELTQAWTQISNFDNEIIWQEFSDTSLFDETWFVIVSSGDIIVEFDQESSFTSLVEYNRIFADIQTWTSSIVYYSDTVQNTYCPPVTTGILTLIDSIETLILRNASWGNTYEISTTRVIGATRSGTPFVLRDSLWPQRITHTYEIVALTDTQINALLAFIARNVGNKIHWLDHYNIRHVGYVAEPATPATRRSKRRSSIKLTLIDIQYDTHKIYDYLSTVEAWSWALS